LDILNVIYVKLLWLPEPICESLDFERGGKIDKTFSAQRTLQQHTECKKMAINSLPFKGNW